MWRYSRIPVVFYLKVFIILSLLCFILAIGVWYARAQETSSSSIIVANDAQWRYSRSLILGWELSDFNDDSWQAVSFPSQGRCGHWETPSPFITTPMWAPVATEHETVYFRRHIDLNQTPDSAVASIVFDDDGELFINGVSVLKDTSGTVEPSPHQINIQQYLKVGENVIAVGVSDTRGTCQSVQFTLEITHGSGAPKSLAVPMFKQTDPQWANLTYDHAAENCRSIAQCGCALTSAAMILSYYGVNKSPDGKPTNPQSLNDYFNQDAQCINNRCISRGYYFGHVRWSAVNQYAKEAHEQFGTQKILWEGSVAFDPQVIRNEIYSDRPTIVSVPGHFLVVNGVLGNTFEVIDPAFPVVRLDDARYKNSALRIYRFAKTSSDFSQIEIVAPSSPNILITDGEGRRVGNDGQEIYNEIPNSYQDSESGIKSADEDLDSSQSSDIYRIVIQTPPAQTYTVQVGADSSGAYSFGVYASSKDAKTELILNDGTSAQSGVELDLEYNPASQNPLVQEVAVDIIPELANNSIKCSNMGRIIPVAVLGAPTFDVKDIQIHSVDFSGAKEMYSQRKKSKKSRLADVNNDGFMDIQLYFRRRDTNLTCESTEGVLTGRRENKPAFRGTDSIILRS